MATETVYVIPFVRCTAATIPNILYKILKLLNLCHVLHILMQKAVILNIYHIIRKFLTEE